jgi:hypothetical protein
MVPIRQGNLSCSFFEENQMKRSLAKSQSSSAAATATAPQLRPAAGYELSPVEVEAVHGGTLKIEMPAYVPLSQSHPKTEVTLPRVPYKK